ncbi:hypothetical protein DUZ99_17170 [Xylanibacillus composti]|uniref:NQR2/RnfD/RnfE family subunit of NADH-ubiquinone oxidoreductase n=1 Tax=Xylanibacillus composti TaxID=1572762 RepID=A0A8J4H1S1_9BACL|nr:hypothetical protein [Xylanibacillus composti]MDT9726710.1 hypothetical protein [Xylanibacillus composti]GIQ69358.1 hypothetical protein XYCOK13_21820 [Xylanibacillus composti]
MSQPKLDPRYFILAFLLSFVVMGQLFLDFFQKWDTFFASVATTMLVEVVLCRWIRKKWIFPLSAFISGIGISLILSSYLVWPYVLAAVLAIATKYVFRLGGSHVFNPNNVAVVFVLFFLSEYVVTTPKQWTNDVSVMVIILVLGLVAAYVAGRLDTVLAFAAGFVLFAYVRHAWFDEPLLFAFGPMMGASFQLFVFFMLTDPKTTPAHSSARIILAFCIAAVDAWFRIHAITNSLFYAAFVVTLLFGVPYRWMLLRRQRT